MDSDQLSSAQIPIAYLEVSEGNGGSCDCYSDRAAGDDPDIQDLIMQTNVTAHNLNQHSSSFCEGLDRMI